MLLASLGCTHLPKETATLSARLNSQIAESKRSHLALVSEYTHQRRERAEDFMRYIWTPRFIRSFMKKIDFESEVCDKRGEMDRAMVLQEVVEAISKKVEKKRREFSRAISKADRELKGKIEDHYAYSEKMGRTISLNLNSVVKGQEIEREIRKAISKPLEKIAPIKEASDRLDALLERAENVTIR